VADPCIVSGNGGKLVTESNTGGEYNGKQSEEQEEQQAAELPESAEPAELSESAEFPEFSEFSEQEFPEPEPLSGLRKTALRAGRRNVFRRLFASAV